MGDKQGRNEQCACGSGKKYKRCCLLKAEIPKSFEQVVTEKTMPLERGTYEEVVTDAKRCADLLNRTILVGDIKSETDLPDEDGYTEFHMLEIELLCPHGNGTDSWYYTKFDMAGGGEPFKEPQDGLWEHDETGTDASFDCRCPGVT
jgi:hypothetical protein